MVLTLIAVITGIIEAVIALLIYFDIDKRTLGRWFTIPDLTRSKIMLLFLIGGIIFSSIALYRTFQRPIITITATSILTDPLLEPTSCSAQVNGQRLLKFTDKYNVAIIYGMEDTTIDKDENRIVTVSRLFNIRPESIRITASFSQLMTDELQKRLQSLHTRTSHTITIIYWLEAFTVPKGTDMTDIQRLSDIPRHGGQLVTVEWRTLGR